MSLKLLIADDEDIIRNGVSKYIQLHTNRFDRIYEAADGKTAIELMLKYEPDLMLLDVQMPINNGIDVMREAQKAGLHPLTVILSGYEEFQYAQQALRFGAKEYLLKPVRASDILRLLNELADTYIGKEESETVDQAQVNHFVSEAQKYIEEHYSEPLTLVDVAEQVGISGGYLSMMFPQTLHMGFVDYLNQVRIEHACTYLEQNFFKNYEIAYRVGFRDEKYFSRVFKKVKGQTPREYRLSQQKN